MKNASGKEIGDPLSGNSCAVGCFSGRKMNERIIELEKMITKREELIPPGDYNIKPISTAPKDGRWIICMRIGNFNYLDRKTWKIIKNPAPRMWWITKGQWSDKYMKFWDGIEPSGLADITHWMEIPDLSHLQTENEE